MEVEKSREYEMNFCRYAMEENNGDLTCSVCREVVWDGDQDGPDICQCKCEGGYWKHWTGTGNHWFWVSTVFCNRRLELNEDLCKFAVDGYEFSVRDGFVAAEDADVTSVKNSAIPMLKEGSIRPMRLLSDYYVNRTVWAWDDDRKQNVKKKQRDLVYQRLDLVLVQNSGGLQVMFIGDKKISIFSGSLLLGKVLSD